MVSRRWGGGSIEGGQAVLEAVLSSGGLRVCSIDELDPADIILTGSLVGSPSRGGAGVTVEQCRRAYDLYSAYSATRASAMIANETGAHSVTNGWIAALSNGLPVVDGACNGRAHPTGVMGAMGLNQLPDLKTVQIAVGGSGNEYIELCESGGIESTSRIVREASVLCGGFITVLRNPVEASYVKENAAIGALSMCEKIGDAIRMNKGNGIRTAEALSSSFHLRVLAQGAVTSCRLKSIGGFDTGTISIGSSSEVTFWNEYMTAEVDGNRLSTFPDLITLLDHKTGLPICSAAVRVGMDVLLVSIPKEHLILGKSMFLKELFLPCEEAIGKSILSYVFPGETF